MTDNSIPEVNLQASISSLQAHRAAIVNAMAENIGNPPPPETAKPDEIEAWYKEQKPSPKRTERHKALGNMVEAIDGELKMREQAFALEPKSFGDAPRGYFLADAKAVKNELHERQEAAFRDVLKAKGDRGLISDESKRIIYGAALTTSTGSGGDFLDDSMSSRIIEALTAFGGARGCCQRIATADGNSMDWPHADADDDEGVLLAENAAVAEEGITTGNVELKAYKYTSKRILVPEELIEDSKFPIIPWVSMQVVRRIGRITNKHFTTGTGVNQPQGIVTAAAAGLTTASATAFTSAEIVALIHSVDGAYRDGMEASMPEEGGFRAEAGMVGFMFSDGFLQALRALLDSESRPLWLPSVREGLPGMVYGYPYKVNYNMASVATGNIPCVFGNFGYHLIRDVSQMRFYVLQELYRANDQTGFVGFCRADAKYLLPSAATAAFKKLTMA